MSDDAGASRLLVVTERAKRAEGAAGGKTKERQSTVRADDGPLGNRQRGRGFRRGGRGGQRGGKGRDHRGRRDNNENRRNGKGGKEGEGKAAPKSAANLDDDLDAYMGRLETRKAATLDDELDTYFSSKGGEAAGDAEAAGDDDEAAEEDIAA